MGQNDVLIGMDEIATFLRVSRKKVIDWRQAYPDMPIYQEGKRGRLCADPAQLGPWQRRLFSRGIDG